VGNRDGDLSALKGREWDVAVDTSGYVPRVVRASTELLAPALEHYTFVSSLSVYADFSEPQREDDPVEELDDAATEDIQQHYGPLKAACEQVVADAFPGRSSLVRAGLIVGPHDPTNRFTYWVRRVAAGGDVLAPGDPERKVQFIDVRDLAEWLLLASGAGSSGTFNAVGPEPPVTMGELLETCREVGAGNSRLVWVDDAFLLERGIGEWMELPLWVASPELAGLMEADVSRAVAAGLTFRPVDETVRATLEWSATAAKRPRKTGVQLPQAGLDPGREAELLEEWDSRR
jgi:2'-hydroxyisoflavone reductase